MLGKQAKTLSDAQIQVVLEALGRSRNAERNKVIFLLSLHGFRAKEIAELETQMLVDAEGNVADVIQLEDRASKGRSGREIPMNVTLRDAIVRYLSVRRKARCKKLIVSERDSGFTAHSIVVLFYRLYRSLNFQGATSHSGRRTFASRVARQISFAGGSIRDLQLMLGHRELSTTMRYIDGNHEAQRKVVEMVYDS
jgi:integrase